MEKLADKTLDILDNWSDRLKRHFASKRDSDRVPFRGKISLLVREANDSASESNDPVVTVGYARNLSPRGVGFIHNEKLPIGKTTICLRLGENEPIYIDGQIVRQRKVHNGFWEHGVEFMARADINV